MEAILSQFHFIRPMWLLAIVPIFILGILLLLEERNSVNWRKVVAPQLLPYLLENQITSKTRWQLYALLLSWVIACIALAGPSWKQLPQPVSKNEAAVVIVWDMSPSVMAEDLKPSRLIRARHKLTDFLNERQEGLTALIAFAGEAHVVSPLTDDTDTIINLLPALYPGMMPLPGSNAEMGVEMAMQLFKDSQISKGDILVVTDEITPPAQATLKLLLANTQYRLSIFGVGTPEGAPIPVGNGGFAKSQDGSIVIASLNTVELRQLAQDLNGYYVGIQPNSSDIDFLTEAMAQKIPDQENMRVLEREFDTWLDAGQYLSLLLLPFVIMAFRRGWILPAVLVVVLWPPSSQALEWRDLWLRKDQQAQQSFLNGDNEQAANTFESQPWKGSALYRGENFADAADTFASALDGDKQSLAAADIHYNRGNALAKAGKLQDALKAYDQALEMQPEMEDAQFNKELIESLLAQQQENQGGESENKNSESSDSENSDSEKNDSSDNQSSEQQTADNQQQNQEQQSDQQNSEQSQQAQNEQQQSQQQNNEQADSEKSEEQQRKDEQAAQELAEQETQQQQADPQLAQAQQNPEHEKLSEQQLSMLQQGDLSEEEQQAMEQWLRQVPDDPSGLLRNKFEYQHRQLRRQYQTGEWSPPSNGANQRW